MVKRVLGLDCSSSCIGYCVLEIDDNNQIKFISVDYLKPNKKLPLLEKIVDTRDKLKKIIADIKPDYIGIEEIIKFMAGSSSANTIITLTTYNRMLCLLAYDYLQKYPELFSVLTIRHGIKKTKVLPKKEEMPDLVSSLLNITFPAEYSKKNKYKVENYDKADAVAVALYYAYKLTNNLKKKTKAKKVK